MEVVGEWIFELRGREKASWSRSQSRTNLNGGELEEKRDERIEGTGISGIDKDEKGDGRSNPGPT